MNIVEISDMNNPELSVYTEYTDAGLVHVFEPESGVFITETIEVIDRALKAGYKPLSFVMEEKKAEKYINELESRHSFLKSEKLTVYVADEEVLNKLVGYTLTRGILCAMRREEKIKSTDIITSSKRIAVLEDVMNPANLGAIFRSAAALGMDAVLLTKASTDPLYRRSARVSMGTVFQIPWTFVEENVIDTLKENGYLCVAMALKEDTLNIDDARLKNIDKLAIFLGSEGPGLKDETIKRCDYTVKIPMSHGVDSLNVAAASAVAFFELRANTTK